MTKDSDDEIQRRVDRVEEAVFGNGKLGIAQQNLIMWRFHVWLLCTLSAAIGVLITILIHKVMKP